MSRNAWIAGIVALVALVGGFFWYASTQKAVPVDAVLAPPEASTEPDAESPAGAAEEKVKVEYPLPAAEAAGTPSLPPLGASDSHIRSALERIFGEAPLESLLIPDQLVRRFVATVNSLDGDPVPLRQRPLRHTPGPLAVTREGDRILLSPENGRRYTPLVTLLRSADPQVLADLYVRYYPLLQKAYAELGYPDRYFNDRMVQVIDHLLETREVAGPVELVQPKVLYEFADRELEKRSSGEKILIRMGPENAEIVRQQLRAFRDAIVQRTLKP